MPAKAKKIIVTEENCLDTWASVNAFLKDADEETCKRLLEREKKGRKRDQFLNRIFSRLNRTRAANERKALKKK